MFKSSDYQNRSSLGYHRSIQTKTPPQSIARHPLRNEQARTGPVKLLRSNTRVSLNFVNETFIQEGGASWLKFILLVLFLVLSPRVQKGGSRGKMVLIATEAVPAGSKPLAAVGVRISTG